MATLSTTELTRLGCALARMTDAELLATEHFVATLRVERSRAKVQELTVGDRVSFVTDRGYVRHGVVEVIRTASVGVRADGFLWTTSALACTRE